MTRLVRIELLKIRTTGLVYSLLATAAGLTALDAVLRASRSGNGRIAPLDTVDGFRMVLTVIGFALLMATVFGVGISSGEFRHETATGTYLATPDRRRVMFAKLGAAALVGPAFGLVGFAVAAGVDFSFVASKGDHVALGVGTILSDGAGTLLGAGLLAALGAALGTLVRGQMGAVVGALVWGFIVESVVAGFFNVLGPYLPFTAATTLAGAPLGGGGFGYQGSSSASPLPFFAAAALVAGIAALIAMIADRTTLWKDVT
jgi:ABC-type transport system involved in multi-copper enzyme maturation permease subunit